MTEARIELDHLGTGGDIQYDLLEHMLKEHDVIRDHHKISEVEMVIDYPHQAIIEYVEVEPK